MLGSLAVTGVLFLSEQFQWFAFNRHKGWTVLIAVAGVGVLVWLSLVWFVAALVLRRRFQFSVRSLLLLAVVVALPFSWLAVAMKHAREQKAMVAAIKKFHGQLIYEWESSKTDYSLSSCDNCVFCCFKTPKSRKRDWNISPTCHDSNR